MAEDDSTLLIVVSLCSFLVCSICISVSIAVAGGGGGVYVWNAMKKIGTIKWLNNDTIKNKCMSVKDGMTSNGASGTLIVLGDCQDYNSTDPNFQFEFNGKNILWNNNGTIINKCLSVKDGMNAKGAKNTPIVLGECVDKTSTDSNSIFELKGRNIIWKNDGTIQNKCISVNDGMNKKGEKGTQFVLDDCPDNTSENSNMIISFGGIL